MYFHNKCIYSYEPKHHVPSIHLIHVRSHCNTQPPNGDTHQLYSLKHDLEKAINIKLVLYIFEQLLGLKINFYKGEI
jgi:hypothetical protein